MLTLAGLPNVGITERKLVGEETWYLKDCSCAGTRLISGLSVAGRRLSTSGSYGYSTRGVTPGLMMIRATSRAVPGRPVSFTKFITPCKLSASNLPEAVYP